jgi:ABC-2 type transport system permease protein
MNTLRIHLLEIKYELLKAIRMPAYALPTICFPLVFYIFFGLVFGRQQGAAVNMATYLIATYGCFGVIGASLFGFGVSVAIERGQGWMEVKRTTPMPVSAYFTAKLVMAMTFSSIIVLGLFALGVGFGHVQMTLATAASLFCVLVLGSLTFSALGLAIGYMAGPNSAAPIVNLIYLPMAFLSGLWIPIWMLPRTLQQFAFVLPPFHFSQIALRIIGGGRLTVPLYVHVGAMVAATVLFLAIAYLAWRRDEGKMYG